MRLPRHDPAPDHDPPGRPRTHDDVAELGDLFVSGLVAVAAFAVSGDEDPAAATTGEVVVEGADDGRCEGDARGLATFAGDLEDAVAVVVSVVADLGVEGFGDPQAAEGEQRDQGQRPRVCCAAYIRRRRSSSAVSPTACDSSDTRGRRTEAAGEWVRTWASWSPSS